MRTAQQAIEFSKTVTDGYAGYCLAFVKDCYDVPAHFESAMQAWDGSIYKVKTTNLADIPAGAPIYFSQVGNIYGHVAIYLGGGYMRTTNSSSGKIETDLVSVWQSWGYVLLGYTLDIENNLITGLGEIPKGIDMPAKDDIITFAGAPHTVEYALQAINNNLEATYNQNKAILAALTTLPTNMSNAIWFGQSDGKLEQAPLYQLRAILNKIGEDEKTKETAQTQA